MIRASSVPFREEGLACPGGAPISTPAWREVESVALDF